MNSIHLSDILSNKVILRDPVNGEFQKLKLKQIFKQRNQMCCNLIWEGDYESIVICQDTNTRNIK